MEHSLNGHLWAAMLAGLQSSDTAQLCAKASMSPSVKYLVQIGKVKSNICQLSQT